MRTSITRKLSLPLVLALLVGLSLAATPAAWAAPMRCGPMGMAMTPEQAGQAFDLRQKFMNETAGVRKEMAIKQAELGALWRAEKPDDKLILAKKKEINALRDQLMEKGIAMRLEMRKICPMGGKMGCPMGMGGGMGMGPGGGMGPGCGW